MKKYFFPSLLCVALFFFTFISCSQNPNVCSDVTITFPVREVYNILAARSGDTDTSAQESVENYEHTGILTIDLYVNDTLTSANSKSQTITYGAVKKQENLSFVFADIEIGSKVQAKASLTVDDLIVCKGESESKVLQNDVLELELVLELVNKDSGTDNSSTGEGTSSGGGNTSGEGTSSEEGSSSGGGNTSGEGTTGSDVEINCNIYLRYYAKESLNSTEDYILLESFGGQTTYTFAQIDDNPYLINTNDDLYSQSIWFEFTKNIGGYVYASEVENSDEESVGVTIDDAGIIYVDYYLIKEKPVSECKSISGVSDQNNYTLKLYSIGDYEICNSSGDSILIGMWSTTEVSGRVGFSEFMYQKDGKKALSPNFYKDGELVMDGSDPRFDLKTDVVNFNAASGTFTLKYYDDEHDDEDSAIPITFTIPQNFDIAAFEESRYGGNGNTNIDSGNYNGGGQISITPTSGLVHISATPSDFYLNTGSVNLKAVTRQEGADVTNRVTWSAKLLYGGVDINDYGAYYSLDIATNSVKLVKNLDAAGTYQLYVTASYNGYTSSQTVDVVVQDMLYFECNVNQQNFDEIAHSISTPAKIVLSGDLTQPIYSDSTTAEDRFIDIVKAFNGIKREFQLDMWGITGITESPEGLDSYGDPKNYTFYAENLTSITIPQSFTRLIIHSFTDEYNRFCDNLTSITIPSTITIIEEGAFDYCSALENIRFKGGDSEIHNADSTYTIDNNCYLYETEGSDIKLLYVSSDYKNNRTTINFANDFPGVTKLGAAVFKNISTLESVNLTGITSIGNDTFYGCNIGGTLDLTGVTSIGEYAFYGCSSNTEISNYDSLRNVGKSAFGKTFNELTLYSDEMKIGSSGLRANKFIIAFDINSENADTVRNNIIAGISSTYVQSLEFTGVVELPDLPATSGSGDSQWKLIPDQSYPEKFTTNRHPESMFKSMTNLTSITFTNETGPIIGNCQCLNFKKIQTITTTGGKIRRVGSHNFIENTALTSIDLSGVYEIGSYAFRLCSNLENLKQGGDAGHAYLSTVQSIGRNAFQRCDKITTLDFSNNQADVSIGSNAFDTCVGITSINLSNSNITTFGEAAFVSCTGLTSISFAGTNVRVLKDRVFSSCSNLETVNLGNVSQIGNTAFLNAKISSVTIPSTVIALGYSAFNTNKVSTVEVTFAGIGENKIATWYKLTYDSANPSARTNVWNNIFSSPKTSFSQEDISSYESQLGTYFSVEENTDNITNNVITSTNSFTTVPYYIRVITSN